MWQRWLFTTLLMMFSVSSWAENTCSVKGNKDFDVTVIIDNYDPSQSYDISYAKNSTTLIWSNHEPSAVIYETSLKQGQKYKLRFFYDTAAGTITYYKNENDAALWSQGVTESVDLDNGESSFIQSGADDIDCDDSGSVVVPPAMPDVCTLVPDALQSNYYAGGSVYGNLSTTPGAGNKIYLPSDDTEMSFNSTFSTDCYYPEAGPVACKVDPSKLTPGYPYELEDHFTGEQLTIAAGETHTFDSGEYWFDKITFGGDKSTLSVNGVVVIHYKQLVIPETGSNTRIYINDDGIPTNLLFIGHGPDAAVLTDQNSAAITSYAHFYIGNEAAQGLTLGGSNSIFYGGLAANAVSLSGGDNVFNGEGSCGDPEPDPEPQPEFDTCTYFPSAIQGNKYVSGKFDSNPLVIARGNGQLGNRLYLDTLDSLPFSSSDTENNTSSNTSGCVYRSEDGSFTNVATGAGDCDVSSSDIFAGAPPIPDDFTVSGDTITIADGSSQDVQPGYYTALNFGNNGSTAILQAGEYWIGDVNLTNNDAQIQTNGKVILHYKKFTISQSRHYINADPSRDGKSNMTPDQLTSIKDPSNLVLIGHGANSQFLVDGSTQTTYVNALVYISPEAALPGFKVDGSQRFQFIGSISAPGVSLDNGTDYTYIYSKAAESCNSPTPDETYTIEVTPDEGYYLSCDAPNITFTVRDENGDIATDYTGNINATFPNGLVPDNANIIQGKVIDADNNVYQPVDGQVVVPVSSGEYKAYEVEGELADDATQKDTGNIEFVPFAFYIDDQHVIANKPQSVEVKALACDSDTHDKVAVNYTGMPEVTNNLVEPENGVGELTFSPEFTDKDEGRVSTDLTFTDSGKVSITLEDKNFDCTGYEGCPIGDGQSDGEMKGSFTVYSRPWTFAICDAGGSNMDGNITDSGSLGYKAAGQDFDLHIKPLRWVSGETDPVAGSENIDVSDLCDKAITQNYLLSNSPQSTIQLSYELAQPSPDIGTEGSLSGPQSLLNTEGSGNGSDGYYDFAKMSWSEVGVLKIKMDTAENYYDMNINQGYRNIGRFYPDHLAIFDNAWDYVEGHDGFAYMNQPIGMTYTVEARSANDSPTQNYGYFAESLQAKLQVVGVDTAKNNISLTDRFYVGDDGTDIGWSSVTPVSDRNAQYQYSTDNFEFFKQSESNSPYVSSPDGPFDADNSDWGIEVTDSTVDEVNFNFDENISDSFRINNVDEQVMTFSDKPDFRYGRMVLDSVSSPIGGPVSVPLRTEFWNGDSYVVNDDDSGSQFKTSVYCAVDEETGDVSGSALLTDTDNDKLSHAVNQGKTSIVQAKQSDAKRETARIFLRQGSDNSSFHHSNPQPAGVDCEWNNSESINQPWLQFNWRDLGDEDPSTVVTFGAYRGNDRIIFRGEEQLTE